MDVIFDLVVFEQLQGSLRNGFPRYAEYLEDGAAFVEVRNGGF